MFEKILAGLAKWAKTTQTSGNAQAYSDGKTLVLIIPLDAPHVSGSAVKKWIDSNGAELPKNLSIASARFNFAGGIASNVQVYQNAHVTAEMMNTRKQQIDAYRASKGTAKALPTLFTK